MQRTNPQHRNPLPPSPAVASHEASPRRARRAARRAKGEVRSGAGLRHRLGEMAGMGVFPAHLPKTCGNRAGAFGNRLMPFGNRLRSFGNRLRPFGNRLRPFGNRLRLLGNPPEPFALPVRFDDNAAGNHGENSPAIHRWGSPKEGNKVPPGTEEPVAAQRRVRPWGCLPAGVPLRSVLPSHAGLCPHRTAYPAINRRAIFKGALPTNRTGPLPSKAN